MRVKIPAAVIIALLAGAIVFTRTKNAPPPDLRDAVAEDLRSQDFKPLMPPVTDNDTAYFPAPKAVAAKKAVDPAPFFEYLDSTFISLPAEPETSSGFDKNLGGEAVYTIDLAGIKNQYLITPVGFKTSIGTFVHISVSRSGDCPKGGNSCPLQDKFFLVFTPANAPLDALGMKTPQLINAMDVVNIPLFYRGQKDFVIDGEKFSVRVKVNIPSPQKSQIVVTKAASTIFTATLGQMIPGFSTLGVDIKLSKTYKLAYGNEVSQSKDGTKFTDKMFVLLLPFPKANKYYVLSAAMMAPPGVRYPTIEADYLFMIRDEKLTISKR